jgi:hypothetical protein
MTHPIPTSNDTCANQHCTCTLAGQESVERDGKTYCSEECARGEGCTHSSCECAEQSG